MLTSDFFDSYLYSILQQIQFILASDNLTILTFSKNFYSLKIFLESTDLSVVIRGSYKALTLWVVIKANAFVFYHRGIRYFFLLTLIYLRCSSAENLWSNKLEWITVLLWSSIVIKMYIIIWIYAVLTSANKLRF